MPTTTLDWRWAVDAASNRTRAGFVAATARPHSDSSSGTAWTVDVYGVATTKDLRRLQCSLDGTSWVPARAQTTIPESGHDQLSFSQRYRRKPAARLGAIEGDNGLVGVRFSCHFGPGDRATDLQHSPSPTWRRLRRSLSVRDSSTSKHAWKVDSLPVRCLGYPIADAEAPCSSTSRRRARNTAFVGTSPASEHATSVTVCVQYLYGTGYTRQALIEFVAWYLLLGAQRIVVFDSMEPELEVGERQQTVAQERQRALYSLSAALGEQLVLVRGLATWDMMRRTRTHMSGQSIAGNMCKSAAAALTPAAHSTYAAMLDLDEFLTPPATDASRPDGMASHLAGSLLRLSAHVHSGASVTMHYLNDAQLSHSRVHPGSGTGRCLSFASVYYWPPTCGHASSETGVPLSGKSGLVHRSWRGHPDNFEPGPSVNWTSFPHWNFFHRSKFLVDTADDGLMTANHECCCKMAGTSGQQCTTRSGRLGNHTCATLEFMPLEYWHIRHLKGSGLAVDADRPATRSCRKAGPISAVIAVDGVRKRIQTTPDEDIFPVSWEGEYAMAISNLTRRVQALHQEHSHGLQSSLSSIVA